MTVAAGATVICLLMSLLLNFPSPKPVAPADTTTSQVGDADAPTE